MANLSGLCKKIHPDTVAYLGNYTFDNASVSCENGSTSSTSDTNHLILTLVVMVCTLVGNLTLIVVLTSHRKRRIKRVNIFLVNLAISDLAVACILMTTEILWVAFDGEWVLGPVICKLSTYLEIVTLAAATFLLTAMSVDRYQVIVKPMQTLRHRPRIVRKVLAAWFLAFLFASPQLGIFLQVNKGFKPDGTPKPACRSLGYTAEWQRKLYFTFLTLYVLIIPTIIMTFCYSRIMRVVWRRGADDCYSNNSNDHHSNAMHMTEPCSPRMSVNKQLVSSSKRKVILMTFTVIIGYLSCCTPYFMVSLIRIYSDYALNLGSSLKVAEVIFMTHSALNPILYGLFTVSCRDLSAFMHKLCPSECIKCCVPLREKHPRIAVRAQPPPTSDRWRPAANRRTPFDCIFAKRHRHHILSYHPSSMGLVTTPSRGSTNSRYQYSDVSISPVSGSRTCANTATLFVQQNGKTYKTGHHSEASQTSYTDSNTINDPVSTRQILSSSDKPSKPSTTERLEYLSTV